MANRRLFWVAVGAFASAAVMLCGAVLDRMRQQNSEMLVISANGLSEEMRTRLLATVGQCLGKFEAVSNPESYEVRIPAKDLLADDYECILRNSADIGDLVKPEDYYSRVPGKVWQGPGFSIQRE